MIGTIVNTCTIIAGTIVGSVLHRGIKDKYKTVLYDGLGLVSLAIGLNAAVQNLPKSQYPVLFIVAIALGGIVGTRLDIDGWFRRIVNRRHTTPTPSPSRPTPSPSRPTPSPSRPTPQPLPVREGSNYSSEQQQAVGHSTPLPHREGQGGGSVSLADGLSTAILLYCIGPLSMLGPVISALQGDHTFLFTNATLDFVSATIFASTYGLGMMLAAPVLFCWQGMFYLVAKISSEAVSDALMSELLIVGGLLITASGLSLLKLKDCKTLNLLPALLVPVLWFLLKSLW